MKTIRYLLILFILFFANTTKAEQVFSGAKRVLETYIDTIPLGKTTTDNRSLRNGFTVAARWEDGSSYHPIILLRATAREYTYLLKAEALVDAAIKAEKPARFFIVGKQRPGELEFDAVAYGGTKVDLETGTVEIEGPKRQTARIPDRVPNEKEKFVTGTFEYSTLKNFTAPTALTDYTLEMGYCWGIVEKEGQKPQVFVDNRIMVVGGGNDRAGRKNAVWVAAQFRDVKDARVERPIILRFRKAADWVDIEWYHVNADKDLNPLADQLYASVKAGKTTAPMIERELAVEK